MRNNVRVDFDRARPWPPRPPSGSKLSPISNGPNLSEKRYRFCTRACPFDSFATLTAWGKGATLLAGVVLERYFISQTPDPTKPMLGPWQRDLLLSAQPCRHNCSTIPCKTCASHSIARMFTLRASDVRTCTARASERAQARRAASPRTITCATPATTSKTTLYLKVIVPRPTGS